MDDQHYQEMLEGLNAIAQDHYQATFDELKDPAKGIKGTYTGRRAYVMQRYLDKLEDAFYARHNKDERG